MKKLRYHLLFFLTVLFFSGLFLWLAGNVYQEYKIEKLLDFISDNIHSSQNRVKYTMNGFVISVGTYFTPLIEKSKKIAENIGKVHVEMGGTACKVPVAKDYIQKVQDKNKIGNKRKTAFC